MGALQSLQVAGSTVRRNPILFVVAAVVSLFQFPSLAAQSISPLLGSIISLGVSGLLIFVMPFFIGGILGMANEAIDRRTSLQTFVREGKANYVSLLVVYFGLLAINLVFGVVSVVGFAVGGAFVMGVGGTSQVSLLPLAVVGLVGLLILLAYLTLLFVTQFFGHAIVIDDADAVDGLKRSVAVVKDNLVSVFGYTIIVTIGGAVGGVLGGLFSLLTTPTGTPQSATPTSAAATQLPTLGLAGIVGFAVLMVLISGLLGGFFAAYSTAFYRSLRPVGR